MIARHVTILVFVIGLLSSANIAWGQRASSGKTPYTIKQHRIVLQKQNAHITHRLSKDGLEIHVQFSTAVLANDLVDLRVESLEKGEWSKVKFELGDALREHPTHIETKPSRGAKAASKPITDRSYQVSHRFRIHADRARKRYEVEIQAIRDKVTKRSNDSEGRDRNRDLGGGEERSDQLAKMVRAELLRRLREIGESHDRGLSDEEGDNQEERLTILGVPTFLQQKGNPEQSLLNYYRWVELDKRLNAWRSPQGSFPLPSKRNLSDLDYLKLGDEIAAFFAGSKPDENSPWKYLGKEQTDYLRKCITLHFRAIFTPHHSDGESDSGWLQANRVRFSPATVGTVSWDGVFPHRPAERRAQWLAFQNVKSSAPIKVVVESGQDQIAWNRVSSSGAWQYVRVVPRTSKGAVSFTLRLSCPQFEAHEVALPKRLATDVQFPF